MAVMDHHSDLSRDLPEYTPNWPLPVKVKAAVYRLGDGSWSWRHDCPKRMGLARLVTLGYAEDTHEAAFEAALKHARGCW
jgi:hypothetical protein